MSVGRRDTFYWVIDIGGEKHEILGTGPPQTFWKFSGVLKRDKSRAIDV